MVNWPRRRKPTLALVPDFPIKHVRVLNGGAAENGARAPLLSTPEWDDLPSVDEIDAIFDRYEDAVSELARASARLQLKLDEICRQDAADMPGNSPPYYPNIVPRLDGGGAA